VLVQTAGEIDWDKLADVRTLGITAGASAPEILVREVIEKLGEHFAIDVSEFVETEEKVAFPLPETLRK
ncbi:MAG TPA: 4-hydroxy-3-methylbut-2-enyl diphosphate reductase, partial [Alphaproteobacteria bacterium]|nr:4-hydroxy-3-methylbut-2-enyl diphosphate reductase [Alphaproteobacteria bacterium]